MSEENKPEEVQPAPDTPAADPAPEAPAAEPAPAAPAPDASKKIAAGICGILLGSLGVHKFILGYKKEGGIMLGVTIAGIVLTCIGIGVFAITAMQIIGLVEGILYLTKSDEEFVSTYVTGQKPWF